MNGDDAIFEQSKNEATIENIENTLIGILNDVDRDVCE